MGSFTENEISRVRRILPVPPKGLISTRRASYSCLEARHYAEYPSLKRVKYPESQRHDPNLMISNQSENRSYCYQAWYFYHVIQYYIAGVQR